MWALATIEDAKPALMVDGKLYPLAALAAAAGKAAPASNVDLFAEWEKWKPVLGALVAAVALGALADWLFPQADTLVQVLRALRGH